MSINTVESMTSQEVLNLIHAFPKQASYLPREIREDKWYLLELLDASGKLDKSDSILLEWELFPEFYLLEDQEIRDFSGKKGLSTSLSRRDFIQQYMKIQQKDVEKSTVMHLLLVK